MAWTPDDEKQLNLLQSMLPGYKAPEPAPTPQGLLGYAGQAIANIPSNMGNEVINTAQSLLGTEDQYRSPIPQVFQQQAPQGFGQNAVALGAGLVSSLPSFLVPELAGTKIASALGVGNTAAKIIGGAAGFAAPSAQEGPASAALFGGVGAAQTAARMGGWKGKLAAGLGSAAVGYQQGEEHNPGSGMLQGAMLGLMPTVVDPVISHFFPEKTPMPEAQPVAPLQTQPGAYPLTGATPVPRTGGGQPIIGQVFPETGLRIAPDQTRPLTPEPNGMQMYNAPDTSGMQLAHGQPLGVGGAQPVNTPLFPRTSNLRLATPEQPWPTFAPEARYPARSEGGYRGGSGEILPSALSAQAPEGSVMRIPQRAPLIASLQKPTDQPLIFGEALKPRAVDPFSSDTRAQVAQPMAPAPEVAPLQGTKIVGPVLTDVHGNELARGKIGQTHEQIAKEQNAVGKLLANDPEADPFNMQHKFVDDQGHLQDRQTAWSIAEKAGQIKQDALNAKVAWENVGQVHEGLHSDNLIVPEAPKSKAKTSKKKATIEKGGEVNATQAGEIPKGNQPEHQNGNQGGQAAEASGSNRTERSTQEQVKPVATVQVNAGKHGWQDAEIIGQEGNTLTLKVKDPMGERIQYVDKGSSLIREAGDDTRMSAEEQTKLKQRGAYWLSPSGEVHDVPNMEHAYKAKEILAGEGKQMNHIAAYHELAKRGWVRMAGDETGMYVTQKFGERVKFTRDQRAFLEDQSFQGHHIIEDTKQGPVTLFEPQRSSVDTGPGPSLGKATKDIASLQDAIEGLHPEAQDLIKNITAEWIKASGQEMSLHAKFGMQGAKGRAYLASGRVGINADWLRSKFQNWEGRSETSRTRSVMELASLLGHEITHIAQQYGERSGLTLGGKPLLQAIKDNVALLTQAQRTEIQRAITQARGESGKVVSAYLAGDVARVRAHYERTGRKVTDAQAQELAAGEFLAELGSTELAKRAKIAWLPEPIRNAVDAFKGAIVKMVAWLKGEGAQFAALQDLSSIATKMFDHFGSADQASLEKAFPMSEVWSSRTAPKGFAGVAKPGIPSSSVPPPANIAVTEHSSNYLKGELLRLGVRGVVGGTAGGLVLPQVSDHQISTGEGILMGALLGTAGPAVAKMLMKKDLVKSVLSDIAVIAKNPVQGFKDVMSAKVWERLGQEAARNPAGASWQAKFVRAFEKELGVNLPSLVKGISEYGRGIVQEQLSILGSAFDKARKYEPNQALLDATERFYTGGMTKDQFIAMLQTSSEKNYGNFVVTAREALSTLTNIFSEGVKESLFKKHLINTSETYLGRFYSAFKEGKFNEDAFVKARAELMQRDPLMTQEIADNIMRDYQAEILANRKMFGSVRNSGGEQAIDPNLYQRRMATEEEIRTQQEIVGGLEHFGEANPKFKAENDKLQWMLKHTLTDGWREWLGEYKNPNERIMMSFMKLYPSSISAKAISLFDSHFTDIHAQESMAEHSQAYAKARERNDVAGMAASKAEMDKLRENSLKFAYTEAELKAKTADLGEKLKTETDPAKLATLQSQLTELTSYMPLAEDSTMGKLSGKFVSRFVRDEMSTYDKSFKWVDQPIMRGIASFNNMIKISRTALNPLTMLRNYIQTPLFMLMSKTKFQDIGQAWNALKHNTDPELLSLLRRRHIVGADFVTSELGKGPGTYFNGFYDSDVATRFGKDTLDKIMRAYQIPDTLHRAGTFVANLRRMSEEKGITFAEGMKDIRLVDRAVGMTERYSMNYANVPRIVKVARQLPFVSLFISYTAEITKILGNLTHDVIHNSPDGLGRLHAVSVLGAMTALPAMLTLASKSALSDKDRAEWEALERQSPDYLRSRFRIPLGKKNGKWSFIDVTNLHPADAFAQMTKAALNGDIEGALAANPIASLQDTPLLNVASMMVSGEDIHTGQSLEGVSSKVTAALKEVLPPIIPPGYAGQEIQRAFTSTDRGEYGTTNLRTGVMTSPSDLIFRYLTSMKLGNVTKEAVTNAFVREAQKKIATQQGFARRVLATNANQADKQAAAEHLQHATAEILKEMQSKL